MGLDGVKCVNRVISCSEACIIGSATLLYNDIDMYIQCGNNVNIKDEQ